MTRIETEGAVTIKALIVDDERLGRSRLRRMLSRFEEIAIVGEAGDGAEGARLVEKLKPDVVFLDIKMPILSGFQMLGKLSRQPYVVFTTAYEEHALRAFEENAVDYLLKPVSPERLEAAVKKLTGIFRRGPHPGPDLAKLIDRLSRRDSIIKRFSVRLGEKILIIPDSDVCCFCAEEKYTLLHTAEKDYIIPFTMKELEEALDPDLFLRVHRSYIVNLEQIESANTWFGGRFLVRMKNGREITVSRGYAAAFRKKIGL